MRSIETHERLSNRTAASVKLAAVSEQAADWFLRARERRFTESEQRALARWFRESPQHIAEFIRMYQLHGLLREVKLEPFELHPEPLIARQRRERRRTILSWLVAALLVIGGLGLGLCVVLLVGSVRSP